MKKTLMMAVMLGCTALVQAEPLSFPDVKVARETAKTSGRPVLTLWYGSDWMPGADKLCAEWSKLSGMKLPVELAQFNEKVGSGHDVRTKTMPVEIFNLPVAILQAPDGTLMSVIEGRSVRSAEGIRKAVEKLLPRVQQFSELVEQGSKTNGVEGAKLLGQALDLLSEDDAIRCRSVVDQIRKKDPKDETGYLAKFCMGHMDMYREVNKILKGGSDGNRKGADRDYEAAEQYIRTVLGREDLSTLRRQQWTSALAYVMREKMFDAKKLEDEPTRKALAKMYYGIAKMDPKSEYGKGAAAYARYWDPDTFFVVDDYFYDSRHQTHNFEKDWHVDVTKKVTQPGRYRFTLEPRNNGGSVMRNYRVAVNGKVVAKADIDPKQNTKTVELVVPRFRKGAKVEVWLTALCRDGWLGVSGVVRMERISD